MSHPNTAFFHPHYGNTGLRPGIGAGEFFHSESQEARQGVLLGSAEKVYGKDSNGHFPMQRARKGAQVVWTEDGNPLPLLENSKRPLIGNASIVDIPTERGGTRHLLTGRRDDGKHIVLIQTGLVGRLEDHIQQILQNASNKLLPQLHGSVAIDEGSRALSSVEEGETPLTTTLVAAPRRLRWWRPRKTLAGTDIRARVMDLWEFAPSAELLVRDIFPGHDFRLVLDKDGIRVVDAPKHADELFATAMERTKPRSVVQAETEPEPVAA